jgi:hypothetical protein|tara:strand:- start:1211 stop:1465 length:255 start_codon:yes stop_codon:yes gene_type:complete
VGPPQAPTFNIKTTGEKMKNDYMAGWNAGIEATKKNPKNSLTLPREKYTIQYIDGYYAGRNNYRNALRLSARDETDTKTYLVGI